MCRGIKFLGSMFIAQCFVFVMRKDDGAAARRLGASTLWGIEDLGKGFVRLDRSGSVSAGGRDAARAIRKNLAPRVLPGLL